MGKLDRSVVASALFPHERKQVFTGREHEQGRRERATQCHQPLLADSLVML